LTFSIIFWVSLESAGSIFLPARAFERAAMLASIFFTDAASLAFRAKNCSIVSFLRIPFQGLGSCLSFVFLGFYLLRLNI
tara:strand:- start:587 stop:826 length:240 start_codon:yes stop_codon:yes gene_type:complete